MKLAFVHDHVFRIVDGKVFSPGRLPASAWSRYLGEFSSLTVVARCLDIENDANRRGLIQSESERVSFALFSGGGSGFRRVFARKKINAHISSVLSNCDAAVIRLPSMFGLVAVKICKQNNIPYAIELVGCALDSYRNHGSKLALLYAPFAERQTAAAVLDAPYVLYVTRDFLQGRYPTHGISMSASNVTLSDSTFWSGNRSRYSQAINRQKVTRLAFIGSLSAKYKGLDTALEALARVRRQGFSVCLEVLSGFDVDDLRNEISSLGLDECCKIVSPLPGSEAVLAWLSDIDIYLHPSRTEGLPRSLIEAMSVGCHCIASNVGGIPELLPEELLHEPNDADRLADLIVQYLRNPEASVPIIEKNFATVSNYRAESLERIRSSFFSGFAQFARAKRQLSLS